MAELIEHIKIEGHMVTHDPKAVLENLKHKGSDFVVNIEKEGQGTRVAFHLLVQHTVHGKELSHEEKVQIETQMKDVLKTMDLIALTILPGGALFFILANFLKLNSYIIPSAFLEKKQ